MIVVTLRLLVALVRGGPAGLERRPLDAMLGERPVSLHEYARLVLLVFGGLRLGLLVVIEVVEVLGVETAECSVRKGMLLVIG